MTSHHRQKPRQPHAATVTPPAVASWQFFIDVGGTFTDVVARAPDGRWHTYKLLNAAAAPGEEAPVTAIRRLLALPPQAAIGAVDVRLGTTRATNALLERKGARTALVTTRGFADVLRIGYQDRPRLFDLHIRKRDELYTEVLEIDERLDAAGQVLRALDPAMVAADLAALRQRGVEALAICLLHAYVNPAHEELIARLAEQAGFRQVSCSSRVARMERIVARGDTTVLDAYLTPVIRGYVAGLQRAMPQARIRLMTSSGGLVDAAAACGKDTVLSGPAGGVVGCAYVARAAGVTRAIGFDMGGTSTDVCRIDLAAGFEYEQETVKAGVRMVTPMLAVETVAAGGGSICRFDGHMLTVGPDSAGADPGPACYGRGGPLTLTDCNVLLGRVPQAHFPFPLDLPAAERRLAALAAEVSRATGSARTPAELAEGFVQIANAHMAAAIKRISIAKGYDLREYALVSFGGAGGQHACAVARALGIPQVVHSPFAGVLSAVGIGAAELKRIAQQSVHLPLEEAAAGAADATAAALHAAAKEALLADGAAEGDLHEPVVTFDLCYAGQNATIPVTRDPVATLRDRFEAQHQQLYGYTQPARGVEVRAVRVEQATAAEPLQLTLPPVTAPSPPAQAAWHCQSGRDSSLWHGHPGRDSLWHGRPGCEGDRLDQTPTATLYERAHLPPGATLNGPAIVMDETSTLVVEPGWSGEVQGDGTILLTDRSAAAQVAPAPDAGSEAEEAGLPNPVRLELFNNRFAAIAEQMGAALRRTALSVNVKERLDYSCALFDASGDLIVNAPHIPVHLGGMSECVKCLMEDIRQFSPGDVYVTNDPYRGGSHLNDVTVITPVFVNTAGARIPSRTTDATPLSPVFFVASRAHHAEIGGRTPGSMPPDSTCLAEEGVLIRAFCCVQAGNERFDELRRLLTAAPYPSRTPEENIADVQAQIAANQTGVRELQALVARHGLPVVQAYVVHIRDAATRKMQVALAMLPPGTHCFEDRMDGGTAIRVSVAITPDARAAYPRAAIDFTGTDAVHAGNLNANRAIVTSAVLYCLRCLIDEDIPLNSGVLAPVTILLPECFLNPPRHDDPWHCAAMVGGNVETSQRIVDCLLGALGVAAASQGTMNNLIIGDPRFGYYETICGGAGAGPGHDGADAVHTHMTNTRLTDPEVLESRYPVRLVRFCIRRGSGGTGRWRGGDGVIREFEFLAPLEVSILSQRRTTAPYGLAGGAAGAPGRNTFIPSATVPLPCGTADSAVRPSSGTGDSPVSPPCGTAVPAVDAPESTAVPAVDEQHQEGARPLPGVAHLHVDPGDRLIIETPGGGGYGRCASRYEFQ